MRRLSLSPAALAAGALLLAGCASTRPRTSSNDEARGLPGRFPRHSAGEVVGYLAASDTLEGLDAGGDLVVASPSQNGRFSMSLDAARDGRLYLTAGALGIEGVRALVRTDSFFVHNRIENELLLGRTEDAGASLPIPLDVTDGFRTLTGTIRPETAAGFEITADAEQGVYLLRSSDGRRVYTVDPAIWRVTRFVRYEAGGALGEEVLFDRFEDADGVLLPRRVSLRRPADRLAATLLYDRAREVASPDIPDRLRVSPGTRRRTL